MIKLNQLQLFLFLSSFIGLISCSKSDDASPGGEFTGTALLQSQEDIDAFGSNAYSRITGNLIFDYSGGTFITDLTPLTHLQMIDSGLVITGCTHLESLTGLENLRLVGTNLELTFNRSLVDIGALGGLESTSISTLNLSGNPSLTDLSVFDQLESIQFLFLFENESLTSLQAFASLERIDSLLIHTEIDFDLSLPDKVSKISELTLSGSGITSLSQLGTVSVDSLAIRETSLENLEDLNVQDLRKLFLRSNDLLEDLADLSSHPNLNTFRSFNNNLKSLAGLSNLQNLKDVGIAGSANLVSLSGLEGLRDIDFLRISNNENLRTLDGLSNLQTSKYGISISNNSSLISLAGLENLVNISDSGRISLQANHMLTDLTPLQNLESVGTLVINDNNQILSIDNFQNITEIDEFLILNNDLLNELQNFENLADANVFKIVDNPNLEDFCSFDIKRVVEEYLVVGNKFNPILGDLQKGICKP